MKNFIFSFVLLCLLDLVWFQWSVKNVYQPAYEAIQKSPLETRMVGGMFAWLLLALGVTKFATVSGQPIESLKNGALLGLITYGVYNGTMFATLKDYPISAALIDTAWGTFALGLTSFANSYV